MSSYDSQEDEVTEQLFKAIEHVNRAHRVLRSSHPESANQLAKISVDVANIYRDIASSISLISSVKPSPQPTPRLNTAPVFPPGLFHALTPTSSYVQDDSPVQDKSVEDIHEDAAKGFFAVLPGEDVLNALHRIMGQWGKARFEDLVQTDRNAATTLEYTLAGIKQRLLKWDLACLTKVETQAKDQPVSSYQGGQTGFRIPFDHTAFIHTPQTPQIQPKSTWATVAARDQAEGSFVSIKPQTALIKAPETMVRPTIPGAIVLPAGPVAPDWDEEKGQQLRVVHVGPMSSSTQLRDVTAPIQEYGPLMSILIEGYPDGIAVKACIIFLHANTAYQFVEANNRSMQETGESLYGAGVDVTLQGVWPLDNEIRSMHVDGRERRRLTFSGKELFTRVPRSKFEAEIWTVAGKANVELIWLFNTGNATVVLASVRVARAVRNYFHAKTLRQEAWKGVQVIFSSDPCEKPLRLITQMRDGPEPQQYKLSFKK
ncbi:MAG: hypothetical protein MMC33_000164 [Icmadophila ericetorum]|nr:hypothetical protein [Icmadophila ericetorum]